MLVHRNVTQSRWLTGMAMFALWLAILAPVASRVMPAADALDTMGAWCEGRAGLVDHPPSHAEDSHDIGHMDACGYCTLLAQQPGLGSVAFVAPFVPVSGFIAAPLPSLQATDTPFARHAPARGPPGFKNA